jgi:hypothetical protein
MKTMSWFRVVNLGGLGGITVWFAIKLLIGAPIFPSLVIALALGFGWVAFILVILFIAVLVRRKRDAGV